MQQAAVTNVSESLFNVGVDQTTYMAAADSSIIPSGIFSYSLLYQ